MFINIITPCSRPENLINIGKSINIPKENFKWIIVFDAEINPEEAPIWLDFDFDFEVHYHKNFNSIVGNAQRNFALDLIKEGYVYFNDDDTVLHPELWENIKDINADFISFDQSFADGRLRLKCGRTDVGYIDSHNYLVNNKIIGDTRFEIEHYTADGIFADACANKTNNKVFIDKVLSIYNQLRP
jgi:hypothetical protein